TLSLYRQVLHGPSDHVKPVSPSADNIAVTTSGCVICAMSRRLPPHFLQCSTSTLKARRRSSSAHG
ncbi:MAG: hypothetical protein ACI9EF_000290, partial [Pseudohongiellaceae bacterium]